MFACPHCRSETHGILNATPGTPLDLRSEDFDILRRTVNEQDIAVTVSIDIPVHESLIGHPISEVVLTPFIQLSSVFGPGTVAPLVAAVDELRALREHAYPHMRRAASHLARGDMAGLQAALSRMPGSERINFALVDPVQAFSNLFARMYAPLEETTLRLEAAMEWVETLDAARQSDEHGFAHMLTEFESGPLGEHRARVVDTAVSSLADIDTLFPAIWAELMEGIVELREYRVMRDDFDTLKSRYQDVFELGSRSLAFAARVANIAVRGDARLHADGVARSLRKALDHTTAANREAWLVDFPKAQKLYNVMKRHTRNDIGHRLVRYSFEHGALIYEDGASENYLLFLVDYLQAVRLSHYLFDVVEGLWHRRDQRGGALET